MSEGFLDQPIYTDSEGVARFRPNRIVVDLLDTCRDNSLLDLNKIAYSVNRGIYSNEEQIQLAQLTGYSVSGFGDLSYVPKEIVERCDKKAAELLKSQRPMTDERAAEEFADKLIEKLSETPKEEPSEFADVREQVQQRVSSVLQRYLVHHSRNDVARFVDDLISMARLAARLEK